MSCHALSILLAAILLVGTVYWRDGAVDLENPEEGRFASQRGRQGSTIGGDLGKECVGRRALQQELYLGLSFEDVE